MCFKGAPHVFDAAETGRRGEDLAVMFLEGEGFTVLERNYRFGKSGEIDIIVRKNGLLVFVEVKSRHSERYGGPLYSITARKKKTIRLIASQYLLSHPEQNTGNTTCRFDMIAVMNGKVEWIEDIFR
jgi:putative endonuclease